MSYQPPLIGNKQLLNFHATSWPASGGWVIVAALLLGLVPGAQGVPRRSRTPGT